MTAPRWIAEALDAAMAGPGVGDIEVDKLATALIERLPMEEMAKAGLEMIAAASGKAQNTETIALGMAGAMISVLADGDPEVVQLAELYQGACRVLDEAGAPYASGLGQLGGMVTLGPAETLDLAGRIRWLAQQRPTRLELESARGKVDQLADAMRKVHEQLAAAAVPLDVYGTSASDGVRWLAAERDQLRKMYEGASADLDRERREHQEAEGAAANRELVLTVDLETARRASQELKEAVFERNTAIRALVESDMPAGNVRRALAELIGVDDLSRVVAATERHDLRARVADQAAYIEQLEIEITALEEEIWEDAP